MPTDLGLTQEELDAIFGPPPAPPDKPDTKEDVTFGDPNDPTFGPEAAPQPGPVSFGYGYGPNAAHGTSTGPGLSGVGSDAAAIAAAQNAAVATQAGKAERGDVAQEDAQATTSPHGSQTAAENALGLTTTAPISQSQEGLNEAFGHFGTVSPPGVPAFSISDTTTLGNPHGSQTAAENALGLTTTAPISQSQEGLNEAFGHFGNVSPQGVPAVSIADTVSTSNPHGSQTAVENALGLTTTAPTGKSEKGEKAEKAEDTLQAVVDAVVNAVLGITTAKADPLSDLAQAYAQVNQAPVAPAPAPAEVNSALAPTDALGNVTGPAPAVSAPSQAATDAAVAAALGYGAPASGFSVSAPDAGTVASLAPASTTADTVNFGEPDSPDLGAPDESTQGTISSPDQASTDANVAAALGLGAPTSVSAPSEGDVAGLSEAGAPGSAVGGGPGSDD
jgi:hypothetical protein